ncbi:MAG: hypothetical protein HOP12_01440 [Candidatus Eisenbacteria bacterium]|uniref:Cytochrome c-552/4 domain-containing protein n=1 Tax=Eiseniibacteriota bacterium TaxID=2212470 RepID=A0A849SE97_UNCEI|nr:hypothetical protein [Candidatus Eisenbacteria bacterium]
MKAEYGQVALVDNGNFFPENELEQDKAWFLMDAIKLLDVKAVGTSPNELRFGYGYLKYHVARTRLPLTSANLIDVRTKKPAFQPYIIEKIGSVKVGFFSLMNEKQDLNNNRDSLRIDEAVATARRVVPELRKKGAAVVVLLSQLGKVESEDLVTAVPGIDAVICGHNVPVLTKGRMVKSTVASYGGEQGQYLSRTMLTLAGGKVMSGENESFMLGPEVGIRADVERLVKAFEDGQNEKMRKAEKEKAAESTIAQEKNADHFVGADLCARCHKNEYDQWKTTSHSLAWNTLVHEKKEATPECITCHVVGYKQNGGFQTGADAPRLANVQCENCHGMGTSHEAFAQPPHQVGEATCVKCHHGENDATWNYDLKLPMVVHGNTTGMTIEHKKVKVEVIPDTAAAPAHGHEGHSH